MNKLFRLSALSICSLALVVLLLFNRTAPAADKIPTTPTELFGYAKIWDVNISVRLVHCEYTQQLFAIADRHPVVRVHAGLAFDHLALIAVYKPRARCSQVVIQGLSLSVIRCGSTTDDFDTATARFRLSAYAR